MRYEVIQKNAFGSSKGIQRKKKAAKKDKAKAIRLANKQLTLAAKRGDDSRFDAVVRDPRKGWCD